MQGGLIINKNDYPQPLRISAANGKEILRMEPEGRIIWFVDGKEIVVKEKSILAIALLDMLVQMTNLPYDYSKLDPELWQQYQEFLKTEKKESK